MKSLKLKIQVGDNAPGEVVEFDDRIAAHFIAKGWAVKTSKKPEPKAEEVKPKGRQVVGRKIAKG